MKLCDYCGFVIKDNDVKCFNCRMAIPGREVSESVVKAAEVQKNVQLDTRRAAFQVTFRKNLSLLFWW